MSNLFILPIEPLEERYTGAWYHWLPESFAKPDQKGRKFESVSIVEGGTLTDSVQVGAFLDLYSTVHYKASQMAMLAVMFREGAIKDGDAIFVADLEYWGVEALRYMAQLGNRHVAIFGFMHAASYTRGDFMEPLSPVGRYTEVGWIAACDRVFVGSNYHKKAIYSRRLAPLYAGGLDNRIVVTGNPWRTFEAQQLATTSTLYNPNRDIDVLFPHRPDQEKNPLDFLALVRACEQRMARPLNVAFTTGRPGYRSTNAPQAIEAIFEYVAEDKARPPFRDIHTGLRRADFYALLRRAKVVVSTAHEENFGYAMVEAMAQGALPLMPNKASYPELAQEDPAYLYDTAGEAVDKLECLLMDMPGESAERERVVDYARAFDQAEDNIRDTMLSVVQP